MKKRIKSILLKIKIVSFRLNLELKHVLKNIIFLMISQSFCKILSYEEQLIKKVNNKLKLKML